MTSDAQMAEIGRNFDFFQRHLSDYLKAQRNRYALLKGAAVVGFFDEPGAADREGHRRFADGLYSIQQVTDEPVGLGIYANGLD